MGRPTTKTASTKNKKTKKRKKASDGVTLLVPETPFADRQLPLFAADFTPSASLILDKIKK